MIKTYLISFTAIILSLSCSKNNEQPVVIVTYQFDKIRSKDSTILTMRAGKDYKEFLFGMLELPDKSITSIAPYVKTFSNTDTMIIYNELTIYLKGSKIYQDQGILRKVNKYHYDEVGTIDEEENVYVLDDGRIISRASTAWDLYTIYEYQDTRVDSLLQADNSAFFYEWRKNKL